MSCLNCPYISESFNKKYNVLLEENSHLNEKEKIQECINSSFCKKVESKTEWYRCEDGLDKNESDAIQKESDYHLYDKQKRFKKRKRDIAYKHHLKKLSRTNAPVIQKIIEPDETVSNIEYPKKYYCRDFYKALKKCRRMANRKVRYYHKGISNGGNYKKVGEVWWEVE